VKNVLSLMYIIYREVIFMMMTDEKIRFVKRLIELEKTNFLLAAENNTLKNKLKSIEDDVEFNIKYRAINA
jgi:hypothetical protein